ncbi:hypothetical protein ACKFKG_03025 [Phormidesmis sp. 146-35]
MIQERNLVERSKLQERDLDRPVRSGGVREEGSGSTSNAATDVASGLALVLSTLAFFFSSVAVIQGVRARQEVQAVLNPPNPQAQAAQQRDLTTLGNRLITPAAISRVEPGRFVQSAYGGAGEVELLSVRRADGSGDSNIVNVEMRIHRLRDRVPGVGDIDLAEVKGINSRTNERYPTLDSRSPFGKTFSLYDLRPDQAVNVSVRLRVPESLDRIDLDVPQTNPFRGVPVATPNPTAR